MTDKQIINGIDVSGCDFLAQKDDYCSYSGITYAYKGQCMCSDEEMCKEHPNCFYKKVLKQLKRTESELACKEQECEELKDLAEHNGRICNERLDKIDELEHDINELNEQLDQLKAENEELREQLELNTANAVVIDMSQRLYKLKQTLTEIKEICNSVWGNGLDEEVDKFGLILQKINEVEND